jgi:putative SOS response-associated peptidase YedK
MCNEFSSREPRDAWGEVFSKVQLDLDFADGVSSNLEPRASIRISETAAVVQRSERGGEILMLPWAWKGPHGKPVFNFRSDGRSFAKSRRVLIPADGFYEFTAPADPIQKRKDKWRFEMAGERWFWIAGIVRDDAFAMLTTEPGEDMKPYHSRQVVVLRPDQALEWLDLLRPEAELLAPSPPGALTVEKVV